MWEKDLKKSSVLSRLPGVSSSNATSTSTAAAGVPGAPPNAVFAIGLADVCGLRKVGGYGWRGKLVIGWALQREVLDGLELEDKSGELRVLTAIKGRDDLFNRLVAHGGHKWECW